MAKIKCLSERRKLYISHALNTNHGQPLLIAEQFSVLTKLSGKKNDGEDRAGLAQDIELEIEMPVVVTWNVHTELNITNGARGQSKIISYHNKDV